MSISFSIITHGHDEMLPLLLLDLRKIWVKRNFTEMEILLTLNLANENHAYLSDFLDLPIRLYINEKPLGFGMNQNQAFKRSMGSVFIIINPDIRLLDIDIDLMLNNLQTGYIGAIGPRVVDKNGFLQDSARKFPTFWRLLKRNLFKIEENDYKNTQEPIFVDWLAGMFIMFNREAWQQVQGFNTKYFMYFEDVEICRRMHNAGWNIIYNPLTTVQHDAQRASHKNLIHLYWHLRSAFRFFASTHI